MDIIKIGLGLQALKGHLAWSDFEAYIKDREQKALLAIAIAEDGLPTTKARAEWQVATTFLEDIDDTINSALSQLQENKQKGEPNG